MFDKLPILPVVKPLEANSWPLTVTVLKARVDMPFHALVDWQGRLVFHYIAMSYMGE